MISISLRARSASATLATAVLAWAAFAGLPALAEGAADPETIVNSMEGTFGVHPGMRRGNAKGVCMEGSFVGSSEAKAVSKAVLFDGKSYPVIGRFSVGGGNPKASDKGKTARGLAFQVKLPGNEEFVTTMISAPVFLIAKPEDVPGFFAARKPDPATGMPDPAKVKAFNDAHPDTKPQIDYLAAAPVPASYATINYWGVNAFKATNAQGQANFVRWRFEPVAGLKGLTAEELQPLPNDFLFDELRKRVAAGPVMFDMKIQVAAAGDAITNPTVEWPKERQSVAGGRLTISKVETGEGGACKDFNFDPTLLPAGIEPSDDPILQARPGAYAISVSRRLAN